MDAYITYNKEYRVLICLKHQYAVTPESIKRHFDKEHHPETPLKVRQQIIQYSNTLKLCEPVNVANPPEYQLAIPGLEVRLGSRCNFTGCMVICGTQDSMKKHVKDHIWDRNSGNKWEKINVQTFFSGNIRR